MVKSLVLFLDHIAIFSSRCSTLSFYKSRLYVLINRTVYGIDINDKILNFILQYFISILGLRSQLIQTELQKYMFLVSSLLCICLLYTSDAAD